MIIRIGKANGIAITTKYVQVYENLALEADSPFELDMISTMTFQYPCR